MTLAGLVSERPTEELRAAAGAGPDPSGLCRGGLVRLHFDAASAAQPPRAPVGPRCTEEMARNHRGQAGLDKRTHVSSRFQKPWAPPRAVVPCLSRPQGDPDHPAPRLSTVRQDIISPPSGGKGWPAALGARNAGDLPTPSPCWATP